MQSSTLTVVLPSALKPISASFTFDAPIFSLQDASTRCKTPSSQSGNVSRSRATPLEHVERAERTGGVAPKKCGSETIELQQEVSQNAAPLPRSYAARAGFAESSSGRPAACMAGAAPAIPKAVSWFGRDAMSCSSELRGCAAADAFAACIACLARLSISSKTVRIGVGGVWGGGHDTGRDSESNRW